MSTEDHDETKTTGAEGSGSADSPAPFAPSKDDDSPVGSTDQHSSVSSQPSTHQEDGTGPDPGSTD